MTKTAFKNPKLRFTNKNGQAFPDWEEKRLENILTVRYGKDHKALSKGSIPVLGTGGVIRFVNKSLHKGPSVLIGRKGTINRPYFVTKPFWAVDTVFYSDIHNRYVPFFVFLIVHCVNWLKYNEATGVPSLNITIIHRMKVFVSPHPDEQKKIADALSAVDAKIVALGRKRDLLKEYKRGLMQKLFSRELRFTDENGQVFPDWEEKRLGNISNIKTGDSNRQDSLDNGKYAFFDRSEDIRTSDRYLFDCEAIIVPGEGQEFIPKYFIGKFDLHQRTYAITNFDRHCGKFLYYSIDHLRQHFLSHAVGSTVKSLRLPMFKKMKLFIPSIDEQKKIADALSAVDAKITAVSEQIEQFERFKKGLLQQMFV